MRIEEINSVISLGLWIWMTTFITSEEQQIMKLTNKQSKLKGRFSVIITKIRKREDIKNPATLKQND